MNLLKIVNYDNGVKSERREAIITEKVQIPVIIENIPKLLKYYYQEKCIFNNLFKLEHVFWDLKFDGILYQIKKYSIDNYKIIKEVFFSSGYIILIFLNNDEESCGVPLIIRLSERTLLKFLPNIRTSLYGGFKEKENLYKPKEYKKIIGDNEYIFLSPTIGIVRGAIKMYFDNTDIRVEDCSEKNWGMNYEIFW